MFNDYWWVILVTIGCALVLYIVGRMLPGNPDYKPPEGKLNKTALSGAFIFAAGPWGRSVAAVYRQRMGGDGADRAMVPPGSCDVLPRADHHGQYFGVYRSNAAGGRVASENRRQTRGEVGRAPGAVLCADYRRGRERRILCDDPDAQARVRGLQAARNPI